MSHRSPAFFRTSLAALPLLVIQPAIAQSTPTPTPTPPTTPTPTEPTAPAQAPQLQVQAIVRENPQGGPIAGFTDADDLLTRLETADAALRQLSADLKYTRIFDLAGDTQTRLGSLHFFVAPEDQEPAAGAKTPRRFAIDFRQLLVGKRVESEQQIYIFDGSMLVEKYPAEKRMVRRQVVPDGQTFDPLKIGEGPLPIPIGQKKADILARFTAELLPAEQGLEMLELDQADIDALKAFVQGSAQLRLRPFGDEASTSDFDEILLWYGGPEPKAPANAQAQIQADAKVNAKAVDPRLLPRMAITANKARDRAIVQLINVRTNDDAKVDQALADTSTPDGWEVTTQSFRGKAPNTPNPNVPDPKDPNPRDPAPITPPGTQESPQNAPSAPAKDELIHPAPKDEK